MSPSICAATFVSNPMPPGLNLKLKPEVSLSGYQDCPPAKRVPDSVNDIAVR